MCEDIQKNGQAASRPQGGVYHRVAGKYVGYNKAKKEFGSAAAKVMDTKTKNAKYKWWNLREMKNKCCELEDDNADLHNQVYRNVCIVSVCLSKSGVICWCVLDVIDFCSGTAADRWS